MFNKQKTMSRIIIVLLGIFGISPTALGQCMEKCPDGWTRFKDSCYFYGYEQSLNFIEATHYCQLHHAHLVTIENSVENAFVIDYLKKIKAGFTWIGLSDMDIEGVWRWYSNDMIAQFTDWAPGQPGSENGEQDCGVIVTDHKWHDGTCNDTYHPFCEKETTEMELGGIIG
ncbi:hypothetical protein ACF0H5_019056 [Mactra antiquata]